MLRHGRAFGQGPTTPLLPEGEAYVAALGRRLAREGLAPVAAYCSTLKRAVDTATIVLGELGSSVPLVQLRQLAPEAGAADALEALTSRGLPEGSVLVVTHLPLVGQLVEGLTGQHVDFTPGTYVEIELDAHGLTGVLRRVIDSA
jgi:phosphohistidine phosphatase SixA